MIPYDEKFRNRNGTYSILVKKRNIDRNIMPDDIVEIGFDRYKVFAIEGHSKHYLIVGHLIEPKLKFKTFLQRYKIPNYIRVKNSMTHSQSLILARPYEFQQRYENLLDKHVEKWKIVDNETWVWLV